jgi:hypothetical protein
MDSQSNRCYCSPRLRRCQRRERSPPLSEAGANGIGVAEIRATGADHTGADKNRPYGFLRNLRKTKMRKLIRNYH